MRDGGADPYWFGAIRTLTTKACRRDLTFNLDERVLQSLDLKNTGEVARLAVPRLADWCAIDTLEQGYAFRRLAGDTAGKVELAMELERL